MSYDEHAACKREADYWRKELEQRVRVHSVVRRIATPGETYRYEVLKLVQIDAFADGIRLLVE